MATWQEIKAKRQGAAPAASSARSWLDIKKERGYSDPMAADGDQRRADAAGRQATLIENRNAREIDRGSDTAIPSASERLQAAKKATPPKAIPQPTNLSSALSKTGVIRTPEQIADHFGVLDAYKSDPKSSTVIQSVKKYIDTMYERTGGVDIENDRDYEWTKTSLKKVGQTPYWMNRFGRLVGGGLKSWAYSTQGMFETVTGLGAEGLAAQYNDPGAAMLAGLGVGLARGDVRGNVEKAIEEAMQRQKAVVKERPELLAAGAASFDRAAQAIEDVGGNDNLGSQIVTMAAANAPDMILSMGIAGLTKSAGTGVAKVGVTELLKQLAKKETRKQALITIGKQAARSALPEISTLPMGLKSFASTYQSAAGKGASDAEAVAAAFASAWVEAAIEGGGVQDLAKGAERGFKAWAKAALGEGAEELWQDWLAPAAEKYIAGIEGIEGFSMDPRDDSIINPVRAGTAALGGAVIGGVIGGPTLLPQQADPLWQLANQMADQAVPDAAKARAEMADAQIQKEAALQDDVEAAMDGKATKQEQPVKTAPVVLSKHKDVKLEARTYESGERAIFEGDTEIGRGKTLDEAKTAAGVTLARRRALAGAKPIEARTEADFKDRNVPAYQNLFPELKEGIRGMAMQAMQDLNDGVKGERIFIMDGDGTDATQTVDHTEAIKRDMSPLIDALQGYDSGAKTSRMSLTRLKEGLRNIIEGNENANRPIEKAIEQQLDYYLENGATDFRTGNPILPNKAYIDAKAFIYRAREMEGKKGYSYSESYLADAEAAISAHQDRMEKDFGFRPEIKIVEPKGRTQKNIMKLMDTVGMRAYFIDAQESGNLSEYYDPGMSDVVFIKTGGKRDMTWAAGHGFFHSLKQNHKSLFKSAIDAFEKGVTSEQIEKYLDTFSETPEYQDRLANDRDLLLEEMLADEMGNTWLEKGFWQDLMTMSQEVFEKMRDLVMEFFDTIMKGFDNFIAEKQVKEMRDKFVLITAEVQERVSAARFEGKDVSELDPMTEKAEIDEEDLPYSARDKDESPYRGMITNVRGGWTVPKIEKELRHARSVMSTGRFYRDAASYDSAEELADNLYFHGTAAFVSNGLKAGSALPKNAFRSGGYDEKYHSISVSKSKNVASNFTGDRSSGSVYTVLLKKGAKVISRPDISDSVELEDIIVELWEEGVDAVKLGDWAKPFSEQELAILNPRAAVVAGSEYRTSFQVFQKPKFENPSMDEVAEIFEKAKAYEAERVAKTTQSDGDTTNYSARRRDEKTLWFSPDRVDRLMKEYASSNPAYSKAYATMISPADFLSLTTTNEARIVSESKPLDLQNLREETQEIFLRFDENTGEITGHEGRHRMVALRNAGIEQVAIALVPDSERNKYNRKAIPSMEVSGEEFRAGRAPGRVTLTDIIPISTGTRGEIEKQFSWGGDGAAYSARSKDEIDAILDKAVKINGITTNFREAGFLMQDGRMLDFSGKREGGRRGTRSKDHREISEAFPEGGPDLGFSGYMAAFMDMGNIRLQGEEGFEVTQIPTKQQEAVLRRLILSAEDGLVVDMVKDNNHNTSPETIEYEGKVLPSRVFNDIRRFYETGEVRRSITADFHSRYSTRRKDEIDAIKNNAEYPKNGKVKPFGQAYLRKWYDLGAKYADDLSGLSRRGMIDKIYDIVGFDKGPSDWEQVSMIVAAVNGLPFEPKEWVRWGDVPRDVQAGYVAQSVNHAEGTAEPGVSVISQEWLDSFRGQWMKASNRKPVKVYGVQVGWGSDGEPVVVPVKNAENPDIRYNSRTRTDTPEFKRWFGDSKVVDRNGNPLVVYHGTDSEFFAFEKEKRGEKTRARSAKRAFFFTDNAGMADTYRVRMDNFGTSSPYNMKPVQSFINALSDENLERLAVAFEDETGAGVWEGVGLNEQGNDLKKWTVDAIMNFFEVYERSEGIDGLKYSMGIVEKYVPDLTELPGWDAVINAINEKSGYRMDAYLKIENPLVIDDLDEYEASPVSSAVTRAIEEGHDGVIFRNMSDGFWNADDDKNPPRGDVYAVFEPTQIKSASQNTGAFDPENPDIRYSMRAFHGTPYNFDKFSTEKIGTGEGAQAYGWGMYFASNKSVAEWYKNALAQDQIQYDGKPLQSRSLLNAVNLAMDVTRNRNPAEAASTYINNFAEMEATHEKRIDEIKRASDLRKRNAINSGNMKSLGNASDGEVGELFLENESWKEFEAAFEALVKIDSEKLSQNNGRLYEVDLAPDDDQMLDWDKPVWLQPEKVQTILSSIPILDSGWRRSFQDYTRYVFDLKSGYDGQYTIYVPDAENGNPNEYVVNAGITEIARTKSLLAAQEAATRHIDVQTSKRSKTMDSGELLYKQLSREVGGPKQASLYLASIGIPGIKYLDGSSRNDGTGDYNYVIFSDDHVSIENKYAARQRTERESIPWESMFASTRAAAKMDMQEDEGTEGNVQGFAGTAPGSPEMPAGNDTSTWSKTADDIVQMVSEFFNVPVKVGRFRQKALGIFKIREEVIRLRVANDMPVLSHELGHYLDKKFNLADVTGAMVGELLSLGQGTSLSSYTKKMIRAEGVAEFMRLYLTNPNKAQVQAPAFMKYLESKLDVPTLQFLSDLRSDISKFNNMPVEKQVLSDVSRREPQKNVRERRNPLTMFYTAWLRERGPFEAIERARQKTGIGGRNIDLTSQSVNGIEAKVFQSMTDKQLDIDNNPIGPSLQEILEPVSRTAAKKRGVNPREFWDNFISYVVARRAMDYKDRGFAMPQPFFKYAATISKMEPLYPEFAQVFAGLRKYEDNNLDLLVASGILKPEGAAEIKRLNPNHMPLYRIRDAVDAFRPGMGKHLGASKNLIRRARGGGETIIDPIESIIADSFIIRQAVEANMVMLDLKNFADNAEGAGDIIEKIPPGMVKTEFTVEDIRNQLANIAKAENDDALADALENVGDEIMESALRVFRVDFAEKDGVVTVYEDGTKNLYEVEKDLYRAVKGLNRQQSHFIVRWLNIPKRILQFGAVTTMDFVAKNMGRDTFSSSIQSDAGINPIDIIKGYASAAKKDKWFVEYVRNNGGTEFLNLNSRLQAQVIEDELAGVTVADRFVRVAKAINEVKKNNNERTRGALRGEFESLIGVPFRWVRNALDFSEAGPRVAEFRKGVEKKGMTKLEAAMAGRKLSQDFNDAGYMGREYNKIVAFFNAFIGGNLRIAETFKNHPVRTLLRGMFYITVPQMLLYFLLNDGDDDYENLPEWKKATFFCIPLGDGKFGYVPKPYGYGFIFGSVPEIALNKLKNNDLDAWRRAKEQFLVHFEPSVIPNAVSPLIDIAANRDPLSGAPIDSAGDLRMFPYQRVSPGTSGNAAFIGQITKNLGSGGVSPKVVDYIVRRYTGSVGDFFWRLPDKLNPEKSKAFTWESLPIIKGLTGDSVYSNQATDNFYTAGDEIAKIRNEIKDGLIRSVEKTPKDKQVEALTLIDTFYSQFNQLSGQFSDDRKLMNELRTMTDLTKKEREDYQREVKKAMNADAASFYRMWRTMKAQYKVR